MGSSTEKLRRKIIESGSPIGKHSINHDKIHEILQGQTRVENSQSGGKKAVKAEQRHDRLDKRRQALQVDRILTRLECGQVTVEDLKFLDGREECVESNCDWQISLLRIDRD